MQQPTVIIHGRGRLEAGGVVADAGAVAHCEHCNRDCEMVAVLADRCICRDCMRAALDASSVARYRLSEGGNLPWGKLTS